MIILDATNESLEVVLGGAAATTNPDFTAHYVDVTSTTFVPGNNHGVTNGTTPATAAAAPGSSTQRQIKLLTVYNVDTASVTLTVQANFNGTVRKLWVGTLASGEAMLYTDTLGFEVMSTSGARKLTGPSQGPGSLSVLTPANEQRTLKSELYDLSFMTCISDTAYWCYMGYITRPIVVRYIELFMTSVGSGTQTAEVALASSPAPPNKSSQTLTKLVADGTLDALGSSTNVVKRNTGAMSYTVPAGTHLWTAVRTAMATTQPTFRALSFDWGHGFVLSTASAGALTSGTSWTGSLITASATPVCPDLRITMD